MLSTHGRNLHNIVMATEFTRKMNMSSIPDDVTRELVHAQQVKVFDALDELGRLGITHNLSPQLIVLGDQSSGKSSVLEALARFHFPVSQDLCTRCPIKLILRKAYEESLKGGVELSHDSQQKPRDKPRLQRWIDTSKAKTSGRRDELERQMENALRELGLKSMTDSNPPHVSLSQGVKQFTEDILVIEKRGPDLPLLNLMDLPGLFQGENEDQSEASRSAVKRMIEKHMGQETNLVLLVINSKTPSINQTAIKFFQRALVKDKGLRDRAIGVITHPDHGSDSLSDIRKVLEDVKQLLKHGCYIVRNQSRAEREEGKSLDDRDREEKIFFETLPLAEEEKKNAGIENLRIALKNALWLHTQDALPNIMRDIHGKIAQIEAEVKNSDQSRATASQRRQYLANIAVRFEHLTTRAINGVYENDPCNESHAIGESREYCLKCKGFFPVGTKTLSNLDSQRTKLRSNVRALNMEFAKTMRHFGKTEVINQKGGQALSTTNDESTDLGTNQQVEPSDHFLPEDVLKYYQHEEPGNIGRKQYEEKVARLIKSNRGLEPSGEVNPKVYTDLLADQSERWAKIADDHLRAVFKVTEDFVSLAMKNVCPEPNAKVRLALKKKVIDPNFQDLRRKAFDNLKTLLECRDFGGTAFFDSFGDVFTVQEQARDLKGRLSSSGWDALLPGKSDAVVKSILPGLELLITSSVGPLSVNNHLRNLIMGVCISSVTKLFTETGKARDEQSIRAEIEKLYTGEVEHLDAARVVGIIETYYKVSFSFPRKSLRVDPRPSFAHNNDSLLTDPHFFRQQWSPSLAT